MIWDAPTFQGLRELAMATTQDATAGVGVLVGGMIFLTLLVAAINYVAQTPLPSPGLVSCH